MQIYTGILIIARQPLDHHSTCYLVIVEFVDLVLRSCSRSRIVANAPFSSMTKTLKAVGGGGGLRRGGTTAGKDLSRAQIFR